MHNLTTTIAILRDAETVVRSRLITDREERLLLAELMGQLPVEMLPAHAQLIIGAIERYNARPRRGPFDAETARPPEGKQDATPVATGPGEGPAEAASGPTEGKPEQAQDTGGVANGSDERPAPAEAPAQAERRKQGAKRK